MPSTSFSSVLTKSSEMDSKILQQLDKLILPKDKLSEPNLPTSTDKSPTNMSPSMLHGQALKSLEAVDSSKFLGDVQDKLDASLDKKIPDARDTTSFEQDTVEESGRLKIVTSCDEATDVVNDVDSAVPKKNISMNSDSTVSDAPIFVASPPQKKWAFRMSVPEDFLELDDDDDDDVCSNGAASHSSTDGTQKVDTFSAERKSHNTEAVILAKPPLAFLECKHSTSAVNKKSDPETYDGSVSADVNSNIVNADASSPSMAVLCTEVATRAPLTSDVASPPMVSNVALPIFSFGDKVASTKDSDAASNTSSFGSKHADEVPETSTTFASSPAVVTESAATESGSFPDPKPETSSRSVYMVEFSMGSGGGVNKSNRKFYRVNRKCNRGFNKVKGKQRRLSVGTGNASSTSIPIQFGSTTSSPSSGFAGNSISTGSSIFGSTTAAQVFGSGTTGLGSAASPSDTNPISSSSGTPTVLLGTSWQPAKYSIFGSTFRSASPSPGFSFGPSTASGATTINSPMVLGASTGSATTTNSAPMVFGASTSSAAATNSAPAFFGSSNGASTSSIFSFTSPFVGASTQPTFGNPSSAFSFCSSAAANNDQMNMEDSVAEDTVASVPSVPVFGQQSVLPSPSSSPFQFGSAGPSASTPFQFGSQLNVPAHQNSSPFPVSGSMGLLPEGSNFSFGCGGGGGGGGDKSNRKFYKVKGKPLKK
ncbi:nuclear pore complex protein NUP1 isoform X1 [Ziziphus jujuba]|uniref:Nuclear pore complex protein NUP1 isoform X1 n=1 Tax=Ziziphus jujuba TaxID=326968 RepID=A0ABM3IC43_ZIZJJ|nr:nuclear pore complex protein NUP1 isoform X1 [Ziziphus jujuba]